MSMNDLISDVVTRIRNGQMAELMEVVTPWSKLAEAVMAVLKEEGYIESYAREEAGKNKYQLRVRLRYYDGKGVIKKIQRVSKPGRRDYRGTNDLPKNNNGLGINIISTSKGVMTDYSARQAGIGGEVLCSVF